MKIIEGGYHLYISKQQFVYIAESIFKNADELKEFETFITSRLKRVK